MSSIKGFGVLLLFGVLIGSFIADADAYQFRDVQVKFHSNGGFEVSIPKNDVKLFAFHGHKNKDLKDREAGTWNQDITAANGDRFVYRNNDAGFKSGDRLHYWLYVITIDGKGHEILNQRKTV